MRNYLKAITLGVGLLSAVTALGAHPGEHDGKDRPMPGAAPLVAEFEGTYTVWYQWPGQRWHATSGLSYYHACQLVDWYSSHGASAYYTGGY